MGKSAKLTRGGNKHRVNPARQKAKLERSGIKNHTALENVAAVAAKKKAGATAKQVIADSLKAIQRQREQRELENTAVKTAQRLPAATPATPTEEKTTKTVVKQAAKPKLPSKAQ